VARWNPEGKTTTERGYGWAWQQLRQRILSRDLHLCQPCQREGKVTPATQVDHIKPKAKGGTDDAGNLQSICVACHDAKTEAEAAGGQGRRVKQVIGADGWPVQPKRQWEDKPRWSIPFGTQPSAIPVTIVCGPPASGKSYYVNANAKPGDVVIDFDVIRKSIGGKKWDQTDSVIRQAFKIRADLIRGLAHSTARHAWLIVTAPTQGERDAWQQALGNAEVVVIATPVDQCLARIAADPDRAEAAEAQADAVRAWWAANAGRGGLESPERPAS
jgi:predicted kinase